jgi:peptide/nickel transport system substrate-binding protein
MLAVQSGTADIGEAVPFAQASSVAQSPDVDVVKQNFTTVQWMYFNNTRSPLNKKAVRQALAYATPLSAISKSVYHDQARIPGTANEPTKYLDRSIKPYPYDTEKARQLLAQAGFPDGIELTLETPSGDSVSAQIATILQSAWKKAGITVDLQQRDSASLDAKRYEMNYDVQITCPTCSSSDVLVDDEIDSYMAPLKDNPTNALFTGWKNDDAVKAVEAAKSDPVEARRKEYFSEFQRTLKEDVPLMGLAYPPNLFAVRTSVHNFAAVPTGWPMLRQVWLAD